MKPLSHIPALARVGSIVFYQTLLFPARACDYAGFAHAIEKGLEPRLSPARLPIIYHKPLADASEDPTPSALSQLEWL